MLPYITFAKTLMPELLLRETLLQRLPTFTSDNVCGDARARS